VNLYGRSFGRTYSSNSGSALASKHRKAFAVETTQILVGLLIVSKLLCLVRNGIAITTKFTRCRRVLFSRVGDFEFVARTQDDGTKPLI
jgi:hypothetical protein